MALLVISTLLKIGFVLTLLLGIAPVLVWAERRQSAMIQDRVGPVRAGVPLPGWMGVAVAGVLVAVTAFGLNFVVTMFLDSETYWHWWKETAIPPFWAEHGSDQLAISLIPVLGGFIQTTKGAGAGPLVMAIAQLVGVGLAAFAYFTRMSTADFIRGPASIGAKIVAYLCAGLAVVAAVIACLLLGAPDSVGELTNGASIDDALGFYAWAAVVLVLLALVHFAAAWVVRGSVDKRGHLTVFGLIHPLADAVKMIWKEDFTPPKADKFLYSLAPIIATIPAFATFAVIPFGPALHWGGANEPWYTHLIDTIETGAAAGRIIPLQVANLNVGILYIFAIAGTGIVGAAIAGYSSDNKYSLLGGLRAASQMVSYEVTLGLTLVGCFMVYNTLLLDGMVTWQHEHVWGFVVQPLALILFFFASIAEMKRVPFDAPEGESEIVAGYFLEYSGMKFGMFMTGEFIEHIVNSAIIVTLFFGGYDVPFLETDGFHFQWLGLGTVTMWHIFVVLIGVLAFVLKVGICCFLQLQVRWTLPRFRYDQIMQLCWKIILPLSLANIVITGIAILALK
jgi:NADH-quinone oxidoreductase subunit H